MSALNKSVARACDPNASAWVSANAGAGKTYVLVTRLVTLMLNGTPPERLLCLTYTRAAAAEMQKRLFDLLGQWAVLDDAALREEMQARIGTKPNAQEMQKVRVLFARALETPGGVKVQTIHAFCESLLNRFPIEAGVLPNFELLDERALARMTQAAKTHLLEQADGDFHNELSLLTRYMNEEQFDRLIEEMTHLRAFFMGDTVRDGLARLRRELALPKGKSEADVMAVLLAAMNPKTLRPIIAKLNATGKETDEKQAARLEEISAMMNMPQAAQGAQGGANIWALLRDVFCTQGGTERKKLVTKAAGPKVAALLKKWAQEFFRLDETCRRIRTFDVTAAIYRLGAILMRDIEAEKKRLALLDYDDLIEKTAALLKNYGAKWILYKLDKGIDHILVDEAQDTAPEQWAVIEALAREFHSGQGARELTRTIFAVGDEKQSIFSFQGADPKGFDDMQTHFKAACETVGQKFHAVPFEISYRSAPEILRFVDRVAEGLSDALTAQDTAIRHQAHRDTKGLVTLWPVEKTPPVPEEEEVAEEADEGEEAADDEWDAPAPSLPREMLAEKIANKITALMSDPKKNIRPRDILILVQSRGPFVQDMLRALKRHSIDVAGADRMKLTEQIAVMDLLATGQAALLPQDNLSLAVFLRSPLGGLSEKQLFDICQRKNNGFFLRDKLRAAAKEAGKASPIAVAWDLFHQLERDATRLPPYEFYAHLLGAKGGRDRLIARLGAEVDDPVNEFLARAFGYEREHIASLQGFLHWVQDDDIEIKRDMEQGLDRVRIMTVHGAKGLEAPIVFLPDMCRAPRKTTVNHSALVTLNDKGALLWRAGRDNASHFGTQKDAAHFETQRREYKRLLYVAMTRARDQLYLCGFLRARGKNIPDGCWYEMAHAAMADMADAGDAGVKLEKDVYILGDAKNAAPLAADGAADAAGDAADGAAGKKPPALPDWLHQPAAFEAGAIDIESPSGIYAAHLGDDKTERADLARQQTAMRRGSLLHALLEGLSLMPPDSAREEKTARAERYLQKHGDGFSKKEMDALCAEALSILAMPFMTHEAGAKLRHEMPVQGILKNADGKRRHFVGRIDRYVETAEQIRLIDYKSNRHAPAADAPVPPNYVAQMAIYRALLAATGTQKKITCHLIWTASASVRDITAAEMEARLKKILKIQ